MVMGGVVCGDGDNGDWVMKNGEAEEGSGRGKGCCK